MQGMDQRSGSGAPDQSRSLGPREAEEIQCPENPGDA